MRQIRTSGIRIAVHQHDIDPFRRIGVRQGRARAPVHAGHLLAVEHDFLVQRAAESVHQRPLDGAAQRLGIDHETTVMRADEPFHPDVAGLAIHLHLGDLRDNRLPAERVGDAAAGEDAAGAACPG